MRVHLHCLETAYDITHSLENHGQRPLERLSRHGLLNDSLMAVHMTQLEDAEIALLAERGTHVVHCPQSNLKLASGICRVPALLGAGVNVSIGTDGAASNNNLDLLEEVRFAALLAKGSTGDATALDSILALEMITINGARALGQEAQIGSIEVGKSADLCAINLACAQTQPLYNIFSQIIYAASSAQFTDVWVAGRRLMDTGDLVTIDERDALAKAEAWQSRVQADRQARAAAS
jgi:5-methylthioadenosine/S-adenosylhomocysteine deaminase